MLRISKRLRQVIVEKAAPVFYVSEYSVKPETCRNFIESEFLAQACSSANTFSGFKDVQLLFFEDSFAHQSFSEMQLSLSFPSIFGGNMLRSQGRATMKKYPLLTVSNG